METAKETKPSAHLGKMRIEVGVKQWKKGGGFQLITYGNCDPPVQPALPVRPVLPGTGRRWPVQSVAMHAGRNPHPTRREIRRSEVGQAPTPSNYYYYYYQVPPPRGQVIGSWEVV